MAIPSLDRAGPDRVFFELACRLRRDQFSVSVVVVTPDGFYLEQLPADVEVHVLGLSGHRLRDRYPVLRLRSLIRRIEPDVVLSTLKMNWPAAAARTGSARHALVSRVPNHVTATIGGQAQLDRLKAWVSRVVQIASLRRADFVVSQSNAMARDLREVGVRGHRILTITNPIDPGWVAARLSEPSDGMLEGQPRLLAIGRLEPQKGFDVLLQALPTVSSQFSNVHLTIIGEGTQSLSLKKLVEELGLVDSVTFVPFTSNPFPSYAAADLLVAPSRWEGLSNVVIEALMVGLPVVTTTGPAAGEDLIVSDQLGRLVSPADVEGLTSAVCDALAADFDRPSIRAWAAQRFGSDEIIQAYGDVLLRAARSRSRARGSEPGGNG